MLIRELNNKKILLWGLGREGQATLLQLFPKINATWTVYSDTELTKDELKFLSEFKDVFTISNNALLACLKNIDVIIKSPGVSLYKEEIIFAKNQNIKITSSSNIWFAENPNCNVIGITGTKGKSTTSTLLNHCLLSLGKKSVLVGNIGKPLISLLGTNQKYDHIILELSSYQLADLKAKLSGGVVLNLYPEHINWHTSTESYYKDKLNIVANIKSSGFLVSSKEIITKYISTNLETTCYDDDEFQISGRNIIAKNFTVSVPEFILIGEHNLRNATAVLCVIKKLHYDIELASKSFKDFKPLPHRLEFATTKDDVTYINDSISTIPEASIAAINSFKAHPIILILGGQDRSRNWYESAQNIIQPHVKAIVCIGEIKDKIHSALEKYIKESNITIRLESKNTLAEAMLLIKQEIAKKNDLVLLSPGAPSYDQFKNFEERGETFKNLS
jgi:UDP-N-acetylmuramoylalanine--D-glutamate ligase